MHPEETVRSASDYLKALLALVWSGRLTIEGESIVYLDYDTTRPDYYQVGRVFLRRSVRSPMPVSRLSCGRVRSSRSVSIRSVPVIAGSKLPGNQIFKPRTFRVVLGLNSVINLGGEMWKLVGRGVSNPLEQPPSMHARKRCG